MNQEIVIVAAKRTPIGSFAGSLSTLRAPELGAAVIKELLAETKLAPEQISEVIMGNVLTTGVGQNPARQAALLAGLPVETPATTVNVVCGSGLKAVQMAAQAVACGDAEIVIAGGQESMSQSPHFIQMRGGVKMGDAKLTDSMVSDGLTDVYHGYHMGITAENIAERLAITREAQDAFALASQHKAAAARAEGRFAAEITPVTVPQRKGEPLVVAADEYIKTDSTAEKLAALRPAFKQNGTVTAGNASGINDGAAAVVVMSATKAAELGLEPLAAIRAYAATGIAPEVMGLGPVGAVQKTLAKAAWQIGEVDLFEANEAFAAQALGVVQQLELPPEKVNVNGGAIALGHPIGSSGCRILVTLLHEMNRSGKSKGVAALCVGGGMGLAVAVEQV
ncbi:acetyl-CoA acetyltransferase [Neisseria dentiae]|uniref:Acetyl-CoA acetyltransferase n=1 Tax=Neisseria dentiae TaxID=194197 RepID=A0A1X3DF57_9NEIS|nr:acetyl-CoA C-acetyltransferase [Neisseria dentiae]OSI18117.1 acetyl-CoA acetyltransferase [Neisseria dentiae]QMT45291.1 acetyl-CoA C-acetyltransferase [Neisseria dentiae]STZ51056.1 Probable acetyl-CoA acyltransferase [Neisseria dentiae]